MEWTTNVHICKDPLVILSVYLQIRELGIFNGHAFFFLNLNLNFGGGQISDIRNLKELEIT